MPAMLSFILECGTTKEGNKARCALRIRVSMSEMGSVINLPACFGDSGDKAIQGGLAEGETGVAEFAQVAMAAAAHGAAIDQARWTGVAGQFRQTGVVFLRLQLRAHNGVFFHRGGFSFVSLNPSFLCHILILLRRKASPSV